MRFAFESLEPRHLLSAGLMISEFMASNSHSLADADGDHPDWIEIYNPTSAAVNLKDWSLTDDPTTLAKWHFPSVTLEAGNFVTVFASGKNRSAAGSELHTNFQLNADGEYLALVQPDGSTIASQYAPEFPLQRTDASYGVAQETVQTTLVGAGSAAKMVVPTGPVASGWNGSNSSFDDSAWNPVQLGVGYSTLSFVPPNPVPVTLTNPTATFEQQDYGIAETIDSITSGYDNGWAVYGGHLNTRKAVFRTASPLTTPYIEIQLIHNSGFDEHSIAEFRLSVTTAASPTASNNSISWTQLTPTSVTSTAGSTMTNVGNNHIRVTGANANSNTYVFRAAMPLSGVTGIRLEVFPYDSNGDGIATLGRDDQGQGNGNFVLSEFTATAISSLYDPNPVNLAQGKPVTAPGATWDGLPKENLADGNDDTFTHNLTPARDFWFRVDLGTTQPFDRIELTNRNDGYCPERLTDYRVSVYSDNNGSLGSVVWTADVRTDGTNCGIGGIDVLRADLDPDGSFEGRWVQVQAIDNGQDRYFQIAELRVFSAGAAASYDPVIHSDVESAMKGVNASACLRSTFTVADAGSIGSLTLRMMYDDGFVAYLNGTEIARRNAPAGTPSHQAAATASHFASVFEEIAVPQSLLQNGLNVLAIQGLNVAAADGDFLIDPELIASTIVMPATPPVYFVTPSPGKANGDGVAGFVGDTRFNFKRGFYTGPLDVVIECDTPGATLVYTLDGSPPTATHGTFVPAANETSTPLATIPVSTTTTLRAVAIKNGYEPSNIDTETYLFLADVIRQPADPAGFPATLNGYPADYAMDQRVVNDPAYANEIVGDLRSIPTLSIVMDPEDLFGPTDGIYTFPESRGVQWERAASAELILPDGTTGFQIDAGLSIWGFGWRSPDATFKHALRLSFQSQYGPTKLDYPLFDDSPVSEFDTLVLRAQGSKGWTDFRSPDIEETQYIHDSWARDTRLAMGDSEGHSTYVQLYLNGLYWGLYNPVERPDAKFGEAYFGGTDQDYDAIDRRFTTEAIDGDLVAWNQMQALADAGLSTPAQYAAIQQYIDIDSLIDYMLVQQYATNHDGPDASSNNMRGLRKREPGGQFKPYVWDMEYTFWDPTENRNIEVDVPDTFSHIYTKLRDNAEFRMRYADRAQKFLFNGGALTPAEAAARWQARATEIYGAVATESARWGDYRRPSDPYTRNDEWTTEYNRLMNTYFPARTQILIGQLRTAGLYSAIDTPVFSLRGGNIAKGFSLTLSTTSGTIYYTLDGSDPRLAGGAISPTAHVYTPGTPILVTDTTLVKVRALSAGVWSAIDEAQFIVDAPASITNLVVNELHYHPPGPTAAELAIDPTWTSNDFEFIELKNTSNTQIDLTGVKFTVGVTFDFTGSSVTKLAPGGYVLVVKNLAAFQARYGTSQLARIAGVYSGSLSDGGETLTLKDRLNADIVNFAYSDSGAWPGRADGDGSSLELKDPAAVPPTAAARATYLLDGNNWRSSREYNGTPAAAGTGALQTVVVNEVLAHTDLPLLDAIELYNSTAAPLNIGGWYLSDSVSDLKKYRIPDGTVLAAHEYRVLDDDDFGAYFRLNAETGDDVWLTSADAAGNLTAFVEHVEFGAAKNGESFGRWPDATGGLYPLKNRTLGEPNNLAGNGPRIGPILISEVMYKPSVSAGQNPDDYEYVEIFNPTASAVALDNWHLADGVSYDFAAGTSLAAHGTLVVLSFNPADPLNAAKLAKFKTKYNVGASVQLVGGFAGHLDDTGETVQLQRPDAMVPGSVPPLYPALVEDEIKYDEASPWPQGANGGGSSLQRLGLNTWGHDAASWTAATPALGAAMMIAASADWTAAGLTLTIGADGKLHLYRSGSTTDAVPAQALGSVTAVVLIGRDYLDDVLTIDYANGNPIPAGGLSFDGGLLGAGDGNTIALKTTAANDSAVLTATQLVLNSATVATYSNVAFFAFDLGGGTNALLVNNTTLRVNQDGAISAGTNVTVDGASGLLDATSIVGDSLTIGASSTAAKAAGTHSVPSATNGSAIVAGTLPVPSSENGDGSIAQSFASGDLIVAVGPASSAYGSPVRPEISVTFASPAVQAMNEYLRQESPLAPLPRSAAYGQTFVVNNLPARFDELKARLVPRSFVGSPDVRHDELAHEKTVALLSKKAARSPAQATGERGVRDVALQSILTEQIATTLGGNRSSGGKSSAKNSLAKTVAKGNPGSYFPVDG
jgi:hypothetical protein